MSDYKEAFWNNNFVAGWKYCEDVPNRCDCGKVYQPKKRIVGGTEVDVSSEVFAGIRGLIMIVPEKQIPLDGCCVQRGHGDVLWRHSDLLQVCGECGPLCLQERPPDRVQSSRPDDGN